MITEIHIKRRMNRLAYEYNKAKNNYDSDIQRGYLISALKNQNLCNIYSAEYKSLYCILNENVIWESYSIKIETIDLSLGECQEEHCSNMATTDYNGQGYYVCQGCDDSLQSYFEDNFQ